jgi:hypothetical protein
MNSMYQGGSARDILAVVQESGNLIDRMTFMLDDRSIFASMPGSSSGCLSLGTRRGSLIHLVSPAVKPFFM